jgi:hypothetical protein
MQEVFPGDTVYICERSTDEDRESPDKYYVDMQATAYFGSLHPKPYVSDLPPYAGSSLRYGNPSAASPREESSSRAPRRNLRAYVRRGDLCGPRSSRHPPSGQLEAKSPRLDLTNHPEVLSISAVTVLLVLPEVIAGLRKFSNLLSLPNALIMFGDLTGLLEQCFDYTYESLRRWPGSTVGVQELSVVADGIGHAGGIDGNEACWHTSLLSDLESFKPRSSRIVSEAVPEQLNEWRHPLRLEIALDKMLDVMPQLEETVFGRLPTGAWGAMLTKHGMKESAEQLAATVGERRTAALGGSYANTSALSFSSDPVLKKLVEDWQRRIPPEMEDFKDTFPEEVSQDDGEMTSGEEE